MSIFGTIMSKVFGGQHGSDASPATSTPVAPALPGSPPLSTSAAPPPITAAAPGNPAAPPTSGAPATSAPVDVAAILDGMKDKSGQDLDWRKSIVDLMKLLDMDSSLGARKELASELHFTGSTEDSATMNIWLHKEVMKKFAENGGKLPADLHA